MNSFTFENVFSKTFGVFTEGLRKSIIFFLIASGILIGLDFAGIVLEQEGNDLSLVIDILSVFASLLIYILINKILLNVVYGNPVFKNLFLSGKQWLNVLLYNLILIIVYGINITIFFLGFYMLLGSSLGLAENFEIGMLMMLLAIGLFFVISFFLFLKYLFVQNVILEKGKGLLSSFDESARMTQGNKIGIFLMSFVVLVVFAILFIGATLLLGFSNFDSFSFSSIDSSLVIDLGPGLIISFVIYSLFLNLCLFFMSTFTVSMYNILDSKKGNKLSNAAKTAVKKII